MLAVDGSQVGDFRNVGNRIPPFPLSPAIDESCKQNVLAGERVWVREKSVAELSVETAHVFPRLFGLMQGYRSIARPSLASATGCPDDSGEP